MQKFFDFTSFLSHVLLHSVRVRSEAHITAINRCLLRDCQALTRRNSEMDSLIQEQNSVNATLEYEIDYLEHVIEAMDVVLSRNIRGVTPTFSSSNCFSVDDNIHEIIIPKSPAIQLVQSTTENNYHKP